MEPEEWETELARVWRALNTRISSRNGSRKAKVSRAAPTNQPRGTQPGHASLPRHGMEGEKVWCCSRCREAGGWASGPTLLTKASKVTLGSAKLRAQPLPARSDSQEAGALSTKAAVRVGWVRAASTSPSPAHERPGG